MKLPVYSRADLSRTVALVVALSLTAVSTSASAREFRAADTEHTMSPEVLVRSQKACDSRLAQDRTIFREAAIRSSQFTREKWKGLEERSCLKAKDAGVTIMTDFDRKPFEAAMEGIYAKTQRDPRGRGTDRTHSQGGVN